MKIVMLVKNTFTHDARVLREATCLSQAGHQVTIICLAGPGLKQTENIQGVKVIRVNRGIGNRLRSLSDATSQSNLASSKNLKMRAAAISFTRKFGNLWLREIYEKVTDLRIIKASLNLEPDVIHSHDLDTLAAGVRIKKKLAKPLIYDSHEMATGRNLASKSRQKRALKSESKLIGFADKVIMASEGYAKRAVELYQIEKPTILLNVPDLIGPFEKSRFNLRERLNFPNDKLLLVHQGILLPNRGIEQAIMAVKEVPGVCFAILGYGQHRPYLEELVKDLELGSRIRFLGPLTSQELIMWSSSADVGLCTIVGKSDSYRNSMPNKLFEYLVSEIPVIASNYEGMGTFVDANGVGYTCNPENSDELVEILKTIKGEDLSKFHENILKAKETYNWKKEKSKLLSVYNKFLHLAS